MFTKYKINIFRSFKRSGQRFAEILECLNHYFLYFIIVERSGKLPEIKLVTSLLVSSRNAENLKLFWFHVHSELQRKTTQNQKLALSVPPRPQHFTEDSFEQNLVVTSLLEPSFNLCQLVLKKDAVPTIFNFTMESCKLTIGQKATKNKRIMRGELLRHFSSKMRFVFRSKTFPTKNSLTQKLGNVQDKKRRFKVKKISLREQNTQSRITLEIFKQYSLQYGEPCVF